MWIDILPSFWEGAKITIELTLYSAVIAFFLAFAAGFGRLSKFRAVRYIAATYVEIFRGTSLFVQLFWIYFALPLFGIMLPKMVAGVLALSLNAGAYGSEIVRSTIISVPKGQTEAAIALNMTPWQRTWLVILPQALVMMLPAFGNLIIELLKGTALVSLVTLSDLTFVATVLNSSIMRPTEIFSVLLIIYFVISLPFTRGIRWIEHRLSVGRY